MYLVYLFYNNYVVFNSLNYNIIVFTVCNLISYFESLYKSIPTVEVKVNLKLCNLHISRNAYM